MSKIEYIKLPLLKPGHFALIPYDKVELELLGEDDFTELLDKKISELTSKAVKDEK